MKSPIGKLKIHESRYWDRETEEARKMHRDVAEIIARHFEVSGEKKINGMTHHWLAGYQVALAEFWSREDEQRKLTQLRHQTKKLAETFSSIHWLLRDDLGLNSTLPLKTHNGSYIQSDEHEDTSVDSYDHPPFVAYKALRALAKNYEALLPAIEMTCLNVHGGIPYKKRAHEAWRVVEATAELSRTPSSTIKVPKVLNVTES